MTEQRNLHRFIMMQFKNIFNSCFIESLALEPVYMIEWWNVSKEAVYFSLENGHEKFLVYVCLSSFLAAAYCIWSGGKTIPLATRWIVRPLLCIVNCILFILNWFSQVTEAPTHSLSWVLGKVSLFKHKVPRLPLRFGGFLQQLTFTFKNTAWKSTGFYSPLSTFSSPSVPQKTLCLVKVA